MRLTARLQKLEGTVRPVRRTVPLPTDPVAFARGLWSGAFSVEDIDRTDPNHTGWAAQMNAFLVMLTPEHQDWLRRERERDPQAYPGDPVLPASEEEILAALDAVMHRG